MHFVEKIEKKHRYIIQSLLVGIYLYLASFPFYNTSFYLRVGVGVLIICLGVLFTQFPNIKVRNFFMSTLVPIHLLLGALLTLKYYPNLSFLFRLIIILSFSAMYYVISLVENIFLVVQDREEIIPLYRVAIVWGQILIIAVSIPLYAGIFKIPVNSIIHAGYLSVSAFLFSMYQLWCLRYENKLKEIGVLSGVIISLLVSYIVTSVGIGVSFIPTEPFLRGLLVSAALMFGLVYQSSYLKNEITRRLLAEYFVIILLFLAILLAFKP
ncbi:hypothetical protein A2415_03770 [candidate division WWE3 bacterium RIFOXYC1_FULL_39_7]|uniref:Uncharacterized protein n=1 Tax=candidate division WWE3 bacterium RIFOXYC1_FULL_39_7 TaxID=1802643 RepID=A0A1F4WMV5_UNCKA|nr:MAG: hypothetical protein A2415_03770 [candidate division WWE3 bacterium RIFOXYC1_FULL_39_7]